MTYDLHSHSSYSDGTLLPTDLVARAAQRGVTVLALTDHDNTGGLSEARIASATHGIRLIHGVEISVTWRGHTLHIVGLGITPENPALQSGLAATRGGRAERARKMAIAFDQIGITGSYEGAQEFAANPQLIGRTHFARYLVKQGVVKDIKSAFKRFLGGGQPCFVPLSWARLSDAVQWIRDSGGVAVIAHPGCYPLDTMLMAELLAEFSDLNGGAIEVVCGSHSTQQYQTYAEYARRYGLAASTGSDFHSPAESYHDLGSLPALAAGCRPVWEKLQ